MNRNEFLENWNSYYLPISQDVLNQEVNYNLWGTQLLPFISLGEALENYQCKYLN